MSGNRGDDTFCGLLLLPAEDEIDRCFLGRVKVILYQRDWKISYRSAVVLHATPVTPPLTPLHNMHHLGTTTAWFC